MVVLLWELHSLTINQKDIILQSFQPKAFFSVLQSLYYVICLMILQHSMCSNNLSYILLALLLFGELLSLSLRIISFSILRTYIEMIYRIKKQQTLYMPTIAQFSFTVEVRIFRSFVLLFQITVILLYLVRTYIYIYI